jgi:hypothetical protein
VKANLLETNRDLLGKLSGGSQHDSTVMFFESSDHGEGESEGLAGAGLGNSDEVSSGDGDGNRGGLDGRRVDNASFVQLANQAGRHAEIRERRVADFGSGGEDRGVVGLFQLGCFFRSQVFVGDELSFGCGFFFGYNCYFDGCLGFNGYRGSRRVLRRFLVKQGHRRCFNF